MNNTYKHIKYSKLILVKYIIITGVFFISNIVIAQSVEVWLTTGDQTNKLSEKNDLSFSSGTKNGTVIDIDDAINYQTMDGLGAAMTGSSAYLIQTKLSTSQKDLLLNDLFTDTGINLSRVRHSIGASDFNLSSYTYNDIAQGQTDPTIN
ncbi:MAG: hypothetical protein HKP48_08330 [Winogradskyella sp.]|uniref:hypothetical protein n=1 Tax=Winogradskyella sp. TaxID=1883156 RepID=UPI00184BFD0B|nr:hypothetical protein [Winogradskyella sp.]MBT8243685.1 hypothetical protein [Winogradskyella sp.]NNK23281.1 hypothetical protein [Winogradskyella sp.]